MDNKVIIKPKSKPTVEKEEKEPRDYFWVFFVGCIALTILVSIWHNMTH